MQTNRPYILLIVKAIKRGYLLPIQISQKQFKYSY